MPDLSGNYDFITCSHNFVDVDVNLQLQEKGSIVQLPFEFFIRSTYSTVHTSRSDWLTLHSVCLCMQRDWCNWLGIVSFWDTLEDGLICPCIDLLLSWPESSSSWKVPQQLRCVCAQSCLLLTVGGKSHHCSDAHSLLVAYALEGLE